MQYFLYPLSAAGEERVDKRSDVGVSRRLYADQLYKSVICPDEIATLRSQ